MGSRALVAVQMRSAPATASATVAAVSMTIPCLAPSARANSAALSSSRAQTRIRCSVRTASMASRWLCACSPAPSSARSPASGRANNRVANPLAAAVRIAVISAASSRATGQPCSASNRSTKPRCDEYCGGLLRGIRLTSLTPKHSGSARYPGIIPIIPRSPGITRIDRSGNTTLPSETAIMVRCIRSMHSPIANNWRTSAPRSTRISILAWPEGTVQLLHYRYEGLDIVLIVIEMKAGSDIVVAMGGNDVMVHQLRGQPARVGRRHGNGSPAPCVLGRRDARPADLFQPRHAAARQRIVAFFDGGRADLQQQLEARFGGVAVDHGRRPGFEA